MKKIAGLTVLILVCSAVVAQGQSAKSADQVRKADQGWLRVFAAKDLAKSVDFVLPDGSILSPGVTGQPGL